MRTRRSNRTRSYKVEKYDFDPSSDEEEEEAAPAVPKRRARKADADDANFDADAADSVADEDDEEEAALDQEALASDASVSDPDGTPDRFSRQRIKHIKPFNVRATTAAATKTSGGGTASSTYLDLEPVAADGRIVRAYCGPYDRSIRGRALVDMWYARHEGGVRLAWDMLDRWMDWTVLPPRARVEEHGRDRGVWSPNFFEREQYNAEHWRERVKAGAAREHVRRLEGEEALPYQFGHASMPVLMGPHDAQQEVVFTPGHALAISPTGLPLPETPPEDPSSPPSSSPSSPPAGWMLDVGGLVTSMSWLPLQTPSSSPQLLALAVVPHTDQENARFEPERSADPAFRKHGVVQLWEFCGERGGDGFVRPSTTKRPRRKRTICLEGRGRAKRVGWSPACEMMAVICGDGNVYIVEAGGDADGSYEQVQPMATFTMPEDSVEATCFAWVNFNRLAVGYSDGTVGLWSIRPNRLLSRHPVHHNIVVDLVSGYPSMPYLLASYPVGGTVRLIDLRSPSLETAEVQALTVATQPHLMGYSDHLLGFFSLYPSAGVLNTQIGFMHHAQYPVARRVFTGLSFPTCISVGRTHPYLLVGAVDGSLCAINPQVEIFSTRREPSDRIRVFQHEHRPPAFFPPDSPAASRGVSRVLQGFVMERNVNPKTDFKPVVKKGKKGKKKDVEPVSRYDEEDVGGIPDPTRAIVYEPLTRVTVAEWNPNEEYGCWAAAAMGSGLVRVMDLGLDRADT